MRWVLIATTLLRALCTVEEPSHRDSAAKHWACEARVSLLTAEVRRLRERIHTLQSERWALESEGLWHGVKGGLGEAGNREKAANGDEGRVLARGNRNGRRRREESEGAARCGPYLISPHGIRSHNGTHPSMYDSSGSNTRSMVGRGSAALCPLASPQKVTQTRRGVCFALMGHGSLLQALWRPPKLLLCARRVTSLG
jgi:hypothetical protein